MLMGRGMALQQHVPSMMQTKAWEKILDFGQIDQLYLSTRAKNIGSFSNDYPRTFSNCTCTGRTSRGLGSLLGCK